MSPLLFVTLSVAGGLGGVTRFSVDQAIKAKLGQAFPWSTFTINVTGSFLLGLLTGLVLSEIASPSLQLVLGTGFLGGYTTFSTASHETVTLMRERKYTRALTYSLGTLIASTAAALLGLMLV